MGENIHVVENDQIRYFTIPFFDRTNKVITAFSTRLGGYSREPYKSLNLSYSVGDEKDKVKLNRELLCNHLGIEVKQLVAGAQVHNATVEKVSIVHRGRGALEYETAISSVDAMVTNEKGVPLIGIFADCVPIYLFDPINEAIGLVHSGWRGTCLGISKKAINSLVNNYGCNPKDIIAAIGPSIGPCCFEVDNKVVDIFKESIVDVNKHMIKVSHDKWKVSLWDIIERQMIECGLNRDNIINFNLCTSCKKELFFSYRREGNPSGRMATLLMLK
ncbi:hypothetical protein JT05_14070 [Desulfosporosinus sp. Tol-M]|nr:hypothetical protein JT05_14070 [Desulfosporosinus sp. Tol-M]